MNGTRMPREERREQILAAATEAFARGGFAGTGLEDVAVEAGVTRVILYRHFDSKADLYRAVLARARANLGAAVGPPDYTEQIIDALLAGAARDPAGFRLLFSHAAREPEFRAEADRFRAEMVATAREQLAPMIDDPGWLGWAAHLAPATTVAAITAWLDAGRPDPDTAGERIRRALAGIVRAAQPG
ncbi:TetR/AcrR family transcriptional regulator [Pseudonocardia hydrocarbonoxydans]|nr:TetR family transcriptional regulator [Pseudonocardia hydrocarbonoxydans]